MGQAKKDRTEQLIDAAKRFVLAEQIRNYIEQHNFDRLVASGVIVEARPSEKAKPPKGPGATLSTTH